MTNQERPVGEQEQQDDIQAATRVVVTSQETEAVATPGVDSAADTAAPVAEPEAVQPETTTPESSTALSSDDTTDTSVARDTQAGETNATSSDAPVLNGVAEDTADEATSAPSAEIDAAPAGDATSASVDADDASASSEAPVAEVTDDAPSASTDDASASSEAPVAETTDADDASASTDDAAPEASFTPVEEESGKPRRLKDLQPGMELEGRVTSIALYGIFVDVGVGRDGLVHISEMSDTRIDSPSDMVQIGDTIKVRVKSVDPDGRRISLTMRSPEREGQARGGRGRKKPELDRDRLSTLRVGDTVEGTVTGIAPFGVFVDIGVGKDGLVHISELAEGRIDRAEDAVQVGQSYTFKLLEVDAEGTRISLSLRRAQRTQRMQQLEKGQVVEGTISGISPFGAFVDIGVGRDGLVHISELAPDRVNRVEDVINVGDKVTVRVLDVDQQSKRISLTMMLEDRPETSTEQREERPRRDREERRDRPNRAPRQPGEDQAPAQYSTSSDEPEEEAPANATLEDLLSKYGNGNKRDNKRRRHDEEEEEDEDTRYTRRQRDAIRRTLDVGEE